MKILKYLSETYGVTQPGDVSWSHAVNSREKLGRFLNNSAAMIIESDIRISPKGIPVAAHPPETESNLSFDMLIATMRKSKQGLKLDFKDSEILAACLGKLQREQTRLSQPIFLNADILQGNGAHPSKFSAVGFLALCRTFYPSGILSIGWTTVANPQKGYTAKNVDEMLHLSHKLKREVTFPVRACLLPGSWKELRRLLDQDGRTLTVWNNEPVNDELRDWIKNNTDPERTFYDFIDEEKDSLKLW